MPAEPDVHLRVNLHGVILHFAACATAAREFLRDERIHHYLDAVTVLPGDPTDLPRLPNERLYCWVMDIVDPKEPSAT